MTTIAEQIAGVVVAPAGDAVRGGSEIQTLIAATEIYPAIAVTIVTIGPGPIVSSRTQ